MQKMSYWVRIKYFEAVQQAEYYRWLAMRKFPLVGNCPITGKPKTIFDPLTRGEGIAAHKAIAAFWLEKARHIRLASRKTS